MNPFGKTLLVGLAAGAMAAALGYGVVALFMKGEDPERIRVTAMLAMAFFVGTLSCGIAAARIVPGRRLATGVIAALAFEAILLIVARPGLNLRVLAMAFAFAAFFASIGTLIGRKGTT